MLGGRVAAKRVTFCTLSSSSFPRHFCYVLLFCSFIASIANLLCLHCGHFTSSSRYTPSPKRFQARNIDGYEWNNSTMEHLEKQAMELERKLKKLSAKFDTAEKVEKAISGSVFRYNVVLVAYKRSGSSFVGQLFNQHPGILYFYEPFYFLKALERIHGDVYRTLSQHLLKTIFTCNFDGDPYFVSQLSDSAFRLYSRPLSDGTMCPRVVKNRGNLKGGCRRLDVKTLTAICQSHHHVVVKSIRIEDLEELRVLGEPNIEAPWNILKIVHLVRDPRAIISSRAYIDNSHDIKNWTLSDYKENSRALCTKMLKDLKSAASKVYNGMYNVVRYEDILTQPECAVQQLFKFVNLPSTDKVLRWLQENTRKKHNSHAFSTAKNMTISLNRWRLSHDLETIRVIEQECSIVMALLGYHKARNSDHLLDISHPLYFRNKLHNFFITRNISDALSEISRLKDTGML